MSLPINDYLQERRIEMKLSIQQLSKESGISASHISRMERRLRNPSSQTLQQLSTPLGVDYITLLKVANLLDNPNSNCVNLEHILTNETCIFHEKEIPLPVKEKILSLLAEYVH
ncbi:helix-turn-helix domain-containing protein (plasmid) [Aneurinibacillus sp. Ricciae_BoGa-3]|uniref:helix-turn-helix domain-containing protein n=1 Tax=Aneurinibacillus sp. Ricciae_BoGa-3 TaxID=3022697 RepID=UPI0023405EB7|nr:helix-turn-helix domain-containing protein [Aneurinibacillus sp. Ricciae_BoGa-3]WCK57727.1 helix-turn-helix domain-containing protein [Aneurinibacillus sp. Ricciae_BoGa-3]